MGAIERFLGRFGYAKLDRYGLVKTPEGRILSTRPAVLNDGLNGKIVGWSEDDLAAMELEHWGEAPRVPAKTVGGKKIVTGRARPASSPPPLPGVAPAIAAPPAPIPVAQAPAPAAKAAPALIPAPSATIVPTPAVEEQPPVEEDEWEWEIAMARARAAGEEVEGAAAAQSFTKPAPRKAETLPAWPKTEEIDHFRDEWTDVSEPKPRVMSPLEKKLAVARTTPSGGTKVPPRLPAPTPGPVPQVHKTVIPVPALPTARPADLRPAFSTAQPPRQAPQPPRRIARGSASLEDTVQTLAAPPAPANDATSPYVTLPPEVKPVGYAHTKRVAAKQR
ncbi:MAG: hypothetical protein HOV81_19445 [Kofleriaceae bacterium]|nr:hypothetical protein [Kofleriaceae bacterium]